VRLTNGAGEKECVTASLAVLDSLACQQLQSLCRAAGFSTCAHQQHSLQMTAKSRALLVPAIFTPDLHTSHTWMTGACGPCYLAGVQPVRVELAACTAVAVGTNWYAAIAHASTGCSLSWAEAASASKPPLNPGRLRCSLLSRKGQLLRSNYQLWSTFYFVAAAQWSQHAAEQRELASFSVLSFLHEFCVLHQPLACKLFVHAAAYRLGSFTPRSACSASPADNLPVIAALLLLLLLLLLGLILHRTPHPAACWRSLLPWSILFGVHAPRSCVQLPVFAKTGGRQCCSVKHATQTCSSV
jgi:hypothetical protein